MNRIKKFILIAILTIVTTYSNAFSVYAADKADLILARDRLQTVIDNQTNSLNGNSYYEANSYHVFYGKINNFGGVAGIQLVIDDPLAEQTAVDDLVDDINNAIWGLVTYETYNLVLNTLNQAKAIPSNTYTLDSIVLYYEELSFFEQILFDPDAGELLISMLINSINEATWNYLVFIADNSEILETYHELKEKDTSNYTLESTTSYLDELNRIYQLIISPNLDSDLVEQITIDLDLARDLLVDLPDFTELQALYDSTISYKEEDYSASSYQALIDAKNIAMTTLANLNATETDVSISKDALQNAIDELARKIDKLYIKEGDSFDVNQYITLGASSVLEYTTDDSSALAVDDSGIVSGIKYGEGSISISLSNGAVEIIDVFVSAKPGVAVFVLTFSIPIATLGIGFGMIYIKKDTFRRIFRTVKSFLKRKKEL